MKPEPPSCPGSLALPEREAVVGLLAAYLVSGPGREALAGLGFSTDRAELEAWQEVIVEARAWQARGGYGFEPLDDPGPLLEQARPEGAALEPRALLDVRRWCAAVAALRRQVTRDAAAWPALGARAQALPDLAGLGAELDRALLPSGEIADAASPELARLRRRRERQRLELTAALERQLRRWEAAGALQDAIVTVRNDRYVAPVRAEARRKVAGVVHGASASGQTLYVEPLECIELNNEQAQLRDAEIAEVARILAALTAAVRSHADELRAAAAGYGALELEAAKARLAEAHGACRARFAPSGAARLELQAARHPLLVAVRRAQGAGVVPLDLALDESRRMAVVSGPNTGGKTVALKTVAMTAWMAQSGLPVCADAALLPVFDAIFADIGDQQSLAASLSTFSSHLVNLREILARATSASLVVLDELGAATDPAEGAALAEAAAEQLCARRAWTLISTHHDPLKAWAAQSAGQVLNASVALDPETLEPTYRLQSGVPGLSAGLAMAARLGLPAALVADARRRLSQGRQSAADYLARLQRLLAEAEKERTLTQAAARQADARAAVLDARERAVTERESRDRRQERLRLRREWEREWERRFGELRARLEADWAAALAGLQTREARATLARLRGESLARADAARPPADAVPPLAPAGLAPAVGDWVRLRGHGSSGRVLQAGGNRLEVAVGPARVQVARADIVAVEPRRPSAPATPDPPAAAATAEINLVGRRAEEAGDELEKFLDRALLSGVQRLRIVHGFGAGSLRRRVADVLRAHPRVSRFLHPPHVQGGEGVTLAELD